MKRPVSANPASDEDLHEARHEQEKDAPPERGVSGGVTRRARWVRNRPDRERPGRAFRGPVNARPPVRAD